MAEQGSVALSNELRAEYEALYEAAVIRPERRGAVEAAASRILSNRTRYEAVSVSTGVPWYVVGAVHWLLCGLDFERHLHNGDPLTGRTVRAPKGRPLGLPPFGWEQSAIDALGFAGLSPWDSSGIPACLHAIEGIFGFGPRLRDAAARSPALWASTSQDPRGNAGDEMGAAAIFKVLAETCDELRPGPRNMPVEAPPPAPPYPGRLLRRGSRDRALVRLVQARIVARGCGAIEEDGDFGPATEAAVRLFQSRSVDRYGRPLSIDGVVGPATWEALFGAETVVNNAPADQGDSLLTKALEVAISQVGVLEVPPGSNRGPEVDAYLASVSVPPGQYWCAAFVYWCFERAASALDRENPVCRTAGCLDHWQKAETRGARRIPVEQAAADPSLIMPGQVFIIDHGLGRGHTGIVERVEGGMLVTVEGNTNEGGSGNGIGVFRRQGRRIADVNVGFIDYSSRRLGGQPGVPSIPQPPVEPQEPPAPPQEPQEPQKPPAIPPEIAPFDPKASSGGLLRKAVLAGAYEPPQWVEIPFKGLLVRVGAHTLRANVGGSLLRLPVSYADVITICNALHWVPPTAKLSDAIFEAATVRIAPKGLVRDGHPEDQDGMKRLGFVARHNENIDAAIPEGKWNELAATEGKDWILSNRNILKAKDSGGKGATTYGWHYPKGGMIQKLAPDALPPRHDDQHWDYSQTFRPIDRNAIRIEDGAVVDLLEELGRNLKPAVLEPFRPAKTIAAGAARALVQGAPAEVEQEKPKKKKKHKKKAKRGAKR